MRGIIFDLDGVIISTDKLHYKAWKKIADKLNIAFDEKNQQPPPRSQQNGQLRNHPGRLSGTSP